MLRGLSKDADVMGCSPSGVQSWILTESVLGKPISFGSKGTSEIAQPEEGKRRQLPLCSHCHIAL